MSTVVVEETLRSASATERLGARVARAVRAPLVLLLHGDLGMGKTTFTRGLVTALSGGRDVVVQSPTFALARTYPTAPVVNHLDLYRLDEGSLRGGHGLEELGLLDLLQDPGALSLVEWPRDLTVPGVPCGTLTLATHGKGRRARLELPAGAVAHADALAP